PLRPGPRPAAAVRSPPTREPIRQPARLTCAGRRHVKGQTHPESGVLAEFRAGLVTGRRRASIASHLTACDRCAGLSDQLGEISALLTAAPSPAMPDDVARRLDLVLAAEAAQRHSSERAVDDSPGHPASSPGPRRRWDF